VRQLTASLLLLAACALVACGGGDSSKQASRAQTGQDAQTSTDSRPGGGGSSGSGGAGGSQAGGTGGTGSSAPGAGAQKTGSGGAAAPRVKGPVHKRTLLRYLALHYRQQGWYSMLRRLRINGGHVRVYLNFPPENDDTRPPLAACEGVLSYGRQVNEVTVYGIPTPQGKLVVMKHC
jgi:hypothetical protein